MKHLIAAAVLSFAGLLGGCADFPGQDEARLAPCTPNSLPTAVCPTAMRPTGVEYPKPQEDRGSPTQAERDIQHHRDGGQAGG